METKNKIRSRGENRAERKAKKRKLEDRIAGVPGDVESTQSIDASGIEAPTSPKRHKSQHVSEEALDTKDTGRKKKKRHTLGTDDTVSASDSKFAQQLDTQSVDGLLANLPDSENTTLEPRKSKKERKAEKKALLAAQAASREGSPGGTKNEAKSEKPAAPEKDHQKDSDGRKQKKHRKASNSEASNGTEGKDKATSRFIVFIGNLPFTATTESIQKHLAAVKPTSVRHLTKKDDPSVSKGCAFVEFSGYDHMKTCLKLFHHSTFDDGKSNPRKINVELTAGGGGKSRDRKAKILQKNQKLQEERIRKIREEKEAAAKKKADTGEQNDIHPSRRERIAGE